MAVGHQRNAACSQPMHVVVVCSNSGELIYFKDCSQSMHTTHGWLNLKLGDMAGSMINRLGSEDIEIYSTNN